MGEKPFLPAVIADMIWGQEVVNSEQLVCKKTGLYRGRARESNTHRSGGMKRASEGDSNLSLSGKTKRPRER